MKKDFFKEVTITHQGCRQELAYYILTDSVSEEYCDLIVYGTEIDRVLTHPNGLIERDKKIIPDLFFVKEEAEEFLRKISDNKITPVELKYAVRDYIGKQLHIKDTESV